ELNCELGSATLTGSFPRDLDLATLLRQPGVMARLDVDLARLPQNLPRTLALHQDVQLTSGRLGLDLSSSGQQEETLWEGKVHLSALEGVRQGVKRRWPQPLHLTMRARQGPQGLPVVERLECDSEFRRVQLGGLEEPATVVTADFDLNRLVG